MKWEILKGSEKDFEEYSDYEGVVCVWKHVDLANRKDGEARGFATYGPSNGLGLFGYYELVAERRPITEPDVNQQVTTEWYGEGLPPVGVECNHLPDKHCVVPHKVTILAHTKLDSRDIEVAVFQYGDVISFSDAKQFIPIRSPEDVAREKSIGDLERAWECVTNVPAVKFEVIYDAIAAGKISGLKVDK